MSKKEKTFDEWSVALAKHAFGVMRIYCMEYGLKKEHVAAAIARLCVELRSTYPDGIEAFDAIAADAQKKYEGGT